MKFFIPGAKDDTEEGQVYTAAKKSATEALGWGTIDRRIQSITYREKGQLVRAEVGKAEPLTGETVIAILDSVTFLVCTTHRGVLSGMPVMVGKHEVTEETVFEP